VVHAAVGAPAAVVGLDAQVDAKVNLEVGLGGADLATLRAHPLGLVEVDGADVVVEVREVGEDLAAVFAHWDVLFLALCACSSSCCRWCCCVVAVGTGG